MQSWRSKLFLAVAALGLLLGGAALAHELSQPPRGEASAAPMERPLGAGLPGQRYGGNAGYVGDRDFVLSRGNGLHEFYFTRAIYSSYGRGYGGGYGRRRGSWSVDWPKADIQFLYGLKRITNIDAYDRATKSFKTTNKVYKNSIETCMFLAAEMEKAGVKPHLSCWAIPFLRAADALLDMGVFKEPAFVQFVLCEGGIVGGHPCTVQGILAFVDMLPANRRIEWTVTCKEGSILPAAGVALERGGHLSPGIGDYPYPELGCPTNAEVVHFFADLARASGRQVATPNETRRMLEIQS